MYIELENARFEDNITFKIEFSDHIPLSKINIPPFVLQPLLENAIWHGVATIPNKKISIQILQLKNYIQITISDNGVGRDKAREIKKEQKNYKKSIGISLVNQILENFYKENYTFFYEELNTSTGTKVSIKIPIQTTSP